MDYTAGVRRPMSMSIRGSVLRVPVFGFVPEKPAEHGTEKDAGPVDISSETGSLINVLGGNTVGLLTRNRITTA